MSTKPHGADNETGSPDPVPFPPSRRRPNTRPILKGNNSYGRKGKLRCLQCRLWRQKCEYVDITLPCTNCSRKGWSCGAEHKIFARDEFPDTVAMKNIPRPPKSIAHYKVPHFLAFHQSKVKACHYFRYDDSPRFFTKGILEMTKQSPPLEYAVASFAALVYSVLIDKKAKVFAFIFYAEALRGLQEILNRLLVGKDDDYSDALAVVLQLASIERFVADTGKCFRHLEGAAKILLTFSTPHSQCSSSRGRSLLEWYCNLENHCCLLVASKFLLPKTWRDENIRVRQELTRVELHHLSEDMGKARLLDDLLQQTWGLLPHLADILAMIPQLKLLKGSKLPTVEHQIKTDMLRLHNGIKELAVSFHLSEILKITEKRDSYQSRHSKCCPPLPFTPCTIQFPRAGFLQLSFLSLSIYAQLVLYTPLRKAGLYIESLEEDNNVESYSFEICRIYSAIEEISEDQSDLLPCFQLLIMAGFSCPPSLRMWLWHKLAHFEELVSLYVSPFKSLLSVLWGMPELLTKGFGSKSPLQEQKMLSTDDVELAAKVVAISLESSDENVGNLNNI